MATHAETRRRGVSTLARFLGGSTFAALIFGALYVLLLSTAADFPRPVPDQAVLALWFGAFLAVPTGCWALLRTALRLTLRREDPPPEWSQALREGFVI